MPERICFVLENIDITLYISWYVGVVAFVFSGVHGADFFGTRLKISTSLYGFEPETLISILIFC